MAGKHRSGTAGQPSNGKTISRSESRSIGKGKSTGRYVGDPARLSKVQAVLKLFGHPER